jgi:hypothetical protein
MDLWQERLRASRKGAGSPQVDALPVPRLTLIAFLAVASAALVGTTAIGAISILRLALRV